MKPGFGYWIYITINETWIRTRTIEENNVVIWSVSGSEDEIVHDKPVYKLTIENPIEMEKEDDYKRDNVNDQKPIIKNEKNNLTISLILLIILIAFVFAEIVLLRKKKK